MSSSNTTDLSLPNTGRKKRNPKPINRLDPSSQTTSKKKNQCSTIATSSRSATSVADAAKPTNNNQKVWDDDNNRVWKNQSAKNMGEYWVISLACCSARKKEVPGFTDQDGFRVDFYNNDEEYLVKITGLSILAAILGYKDGITQKAKGGRGGKKVKQTGAVQYLHNLKKFGFSLTEKNIDLLKETNPHKVSQMLNDTESELYLRYHGDGPPLDPRLKRKDVVQKYLSRGNDGSETQFNVRVKAHEDAIIANAPVDLNIYTSTPSKRRVGSTNSKNEAGRWVGSNDTSVRNALKKEGEKKIGNTDFIVSPNKAKARHPLGLTEVGEELLNKKKKRKKDEMEVDECDENSKPSGRRRRRNAQY